MPMQPRPIAPAFNPLRPNSRVCITARLQRRLTALYANYGMHFVWHIERGNGTKGKIVKFQMRPDPITR